MSTLCWSIKLPRTGSRSPVAAASIFNNASV